MDSVNTVKIFDYWAFHGDGRVQFFQICEGKITDYREYACPEDAPIIQVNEAEGIIGPVHDLRYYGRSYVAPDHDDQTTNGR